MILEKLTNLNYKRVCDFNNNKIRERLNYFIHNRFLPEGATYFAKVVEQTNVYQRSDESEFTNTISLTIIFLIDENTDQLYDFFSVVSYPFELRTTMDFQALQQLFNIYQNDVKIIMEEEQKYENN